MYHTQEKRENLFTAPIKCEKENAWIGMAWYFWYDEDDAVHWGNNFKSRNGYYDIYSAELNCENVLDTVFEEEHYKFWITQIKKAELRFVKDGIKLSLKQLNDYFLQKGIWLKFDGIMFQDISANPKNYIISDFQYKKRIQLAVYNFNIISTFAHHYQGQRV